MPGWVNSASSSLPSSDSFGRLAERRDLLPGSFRTGRIGTDCNMAGSSIVVVSLEGRLNAVEADEHPFQQVVSLERNRGVSCSC